jgi:hypothetical protein
MAISTLMPPGSKDAWPSKNRSTLNPPIRATPHTASPHAGMCMRDRVRDSIKLDDAEATGRMWWLRGACQAVAAAGQSGGQPRN